MAFELESRDGNLFEYGFNGSDTSRVHLGDNIPPITTDQFAEYAVETIGKTVPDIAPNEKAKWGDVAKEIKTALEKTPTKDAATKFSEYQAPETIIYDPEDKKETAQADAAITASLANERGDMTIFYKNNPFVKLDNNDVSIAGKYDIGPDTFFYTTTHILKGGGSWGTLGVSSEVKDAAEKLNSIFNPKDKTEDK